MTSLLYYLINEIMDMKIVKATSKGQVTLPKAWRDQFKTNNFMIVVKKEKLEIKPVALEDLNEDHTRIPGIRRVVGKKNFFRVKSNNL